MGLDPRAVATANRQLWAAHPELNGRQLTMEPHDTALRKEWMANYKKAAAAPPKPPPPKATPKPAAKPVPDGKAGPVVECPKKAHCKAIKDRIDELDEADVRAALAADVYDVYHPENPKPNEPLPGGFKRLSDDEVAGVLGVDAADVPDLLHPKNSSYRAAVYRNGAGKTVLSFRGTENAEGAKDWKVNAGQGVGVEMEHYNKAKGLSQKMASAVGKDNLEIVGHSKGGGMAAAGGVASGAKTTTFNAAGVHPNTVGGPENLKKADDTVTSYVVDGEFLNWAQDNRGKVQAGVVAAAASLGPLGAAVAAVLVRDTIPPSVGKRVPLPSDVKPTDLLYRIELHGMKKVREAIKQLRTAAETSYKDGGCEAACGPL